MNQMDEWYKIEDGKAVIELRAPLLRNLFDERDPAPFRERDLDDDAAEYIVSAAQDIHPKKLGKLRIIVNDPQLEERRALAIAAIHDYFEYHVDLTKRKRRNAFDIGIRSLLIGLAFLSVSIIVSKTVSENVDDAFWRLLLKEGLLLTGWVSMWKPINFFLYEWWPIRDLINIYEKLRTIDIQIVSKE
jgi:hypothetical protein